MGVRGTARKKKEHTPVMQQFLRAKGQYPDAIIFFRLGDFYEMFYEDAQLAADLLDIALTSRGKGPDGQKIPMAGVPHHAAIGYLASLLRQGQKVAICEQMADPSSVKGVVPREVVRVVTPGLCLEPDALDAKAENFLVALGAERGLAALELSTGTLRVCAIDDETQLLSELVRLSPAEILIPKGAAHLRSLCTDLLPCASLREVASMGVDVAASRVAGLLPDGDAQHWLEQAPEAETIAAGLALRYAKDNQPTSELRIQEVSRYTPAERLVLDDAAVRNLELVRTLDGERRGSLLELLDVTRTPMGARALRRDLLEPLTSLDRIQRRLDAVESFFLDPRGRDEASEALKQIGDLERLAVRAAVGLATPRDLGVIRNSLEAAETLFSQLMKRPGVALNDAVGALDTGDLCPDVLTLLRDALVAEPPVVDRQGGIFAEGYSQELDELRVLSAESKGVVLDLERRERERTGVSSLKIKYTRVFGYYIEITKANLRGVPDDYVRKQTIANGERFITAELAVLQDKIVHADEHARALEVREFSTLVKTVGDHAPRLHRLARAIASVDTAVAWAEVSHRYDYVRPEVDASTKLQLEDSRHPTVERHSAEGIFVPNTIELDPDDIKLMLLTGPNMSGKSTAMRQAALCVIMAQAGGFVPARCAHIGLVDRIYTRVGASDQLARGNSTFMVEMTETSNILRGATKRSFVILDEIGRGTSTYDGLAIAWAVTEHLHDVTGCRTIFATHYHELCALAEQLPGAANYNVAAKEHGEEMIFLHQLVRGGANRSYGLAVARLAGVPPIVLARAKSKLGELETAQEAGASAIRPQIGLFEESPGVSDALRTTIQALDLERMTPIDALVALARLRDLVDHENED